MKKRLFIMYRKAWEGAKFVKLNRLSRFRKYEDLYKYVKFVQKNELEKNAIGVEGLYLDAQYLSKPALKLKTFNDEPEASESKIVSREFDLVEKQWGITVR